MPLSTMRIPPSEGVDPDVLYLLSSTSEAYSWLIKLLCDAGDAVLAPKPGYPLIESIARLECVDTVEYQLQFDGSWFIDIAELERLLSEPVANASEHWCSSTRTIRPVRT